MVTALSKEMQSLRGNLDVANNRLQDLTNERDDWLQMQSDLKAQISLNHDQLEVKVIEKMEVEKKLQKKEDEVCLKH